MKILVDTNRYTDFVHKTPEAVDRFMEADKVVMPFVVVAELRAGYRNGTHAGRNDADLATFLRGSKVETLFADMETTRVYAELYASMRRAGTPIPTNDLWIAALAVQHSLPLYTRDRHFEKVRDLTLL